MGLSFSEVPAAPGGDHKCRTCGFSAINAKALSLHEVGRHQEEKGGEENEKEAKEGSTVKPQKPSTQRSPAEMKTCPFIGCDFKGMRLFNHQVKATLSSDGISWNVVTLAYFTCRTMSTLATPSMGAKLMRTSTNTWRSCPGTGGGIGGTSASCA